MYKKAFYIVIIIIFAAISFSVYIHEEDIDDMAYIIAIGIDKGKEQNLSITFNVSIPFKSGVGSNSGSSGGESSNDSKDTFTRTVECDTINSGMYKANNLVSKKLSLTHCKFIILSEEIASDGIYDYINTLENNLEIRASCNVLISSTDAKTFIENSKPILEVSTAQYYEIIEASTKHTGYTSRTTLNTVYTSIDDTFGEFCTILGKVVDKEESQSSNTSSNDSSSESKSQNEKEVEIGGLAVFKSDKFVGELNLDETLCYLLVCCKLKESQVSITNPFDEDNLIDVHILQTGKTKNKVQIINSIPHISSDIYIEATLLSSSSDFSANSKDDIKELENTISEYFKQSIMNYFNKISREYKSDICEFGRYAVKYFPTEQDWIDYDWSQKFEEAVFDVNVNIDLNTSYFIS